MTNYTPTQLEAWAGLGPWEWCENWLYVANYNEHPGPVLWYTANDDGVHAKPDDAALIAAAPDLARLVLEKDAEIARLRSEVRLCHMQVESAYKELGRATAKVKAWEEIVCLDPSSDPFKVVMSDDWVEQEQVKVQIPSVQKITALLDELAAARQAMKESSDE